MENKKLIVFLFFAAASLFGFLFVGANDVMEVEVDVFAAGGGDDVISIDVPGKIDFGEIEFGEKSEEFKVYVNNTGNVKITVTPRLMDNDEEIFDYLYFRKFKTSNGSDVPFNKIGDFSFDINEPASGEDYKSAYFYVILDLRDYEGEVGEDIMNHVADVKFYAVAS